MFHWIHKLLHPHCPDCKRDEEDKSICQSCEVYKVQLAIANQEKERLLQALLDDHKPAEVEPKKPFKSVNTAIPWAARRQMLEQEDRRAAQLLAAQQTTDEKGQDKVVEDKEIEELEKALGIVE